MFLPAILNRIKNNISDLSRKNKIKSKIKLQTTINNTHK